MFELVSPLGVLVAAIAIPAGVPRTAATTQGEIPRVVPVEWLATRLSDPRVVVLHVGTQEEYDSAHIAGAGFLPYRAIATRAASGLTTQLPPVAVLDSILEALGVSSDSRVVLYTGTDWVTPTARVYATLDAIGIGDRTAILDGGLRAWRAAGRPVTTETSSRAAGSLVPRPRNDVFVDVDWVRRRLDDPKVAIVDARAPRYYDGSDIAWYARAGHLPGASNVHFADLIDDDLRMKDLAALRKILADAGVRPGDVVVAYCHVGQQASLVYLAARMLGHEARIYDGSFQEWSVRDDLPVEAPPGADLARLLSTQELAMRLRAGWDATLIDARSDLGDYLRDHIPGAVFLHNETLRAASGGVPAALLPAKSYATLFERLGVRRNRPVVVYATGDAQNFHATFVVWLLRAFGHPSVYLLDGGFDRWRAEDRPVARAYPDVEPAPFPATPFRPDLATLEDVRRAVERRDAVLVDARPLDQYAGRTGAQMRRGHIPGAIDHFWHGDLVPAEGTAAFRSLEELRAAYERQGITPDQDIIVYCNTGTEASHLYFVLHELLKYPRVRVYVPSWTEWSEREELPIETGEG